MSPSRRRQRSRGFLLMELLASLVLLGVVLAGLTPLLITSIRGVDQGRRTTAATTVARDKIEDIRNTPFAAVAGGSDVVKETTTGRDYARRWTVSAGPTPTTKTVTVTVSWGDHRQHRVVLPTMVVQ